VRIWGVERNRAEFAEFYTSARDDCLRIVTVSVGSRQLAEDLVAEGFARAWTSWRRVRQHPSPLAWVVRTALNVHVSWWRRRSREVALDGHNPPAPGDQDWATGGAVMDVVRRLPARQRQVIMLRLLLDLDMRTTARILGISEATVGVHLHRAVAALRTELAASGSLEPRG
jgi:RNA polymerase sigma-70 factor (sigma-E family)